MLKFSLAFLLGTCLLQVLPDTSFSIWFYLLAVAASLIYFWQINSKYQTILKLILMFFAGAAYVLYHANVHLAHILSAEHEQQAITIVGRVTDIPQYKNNNVKFDFLIEEVLQPNNSHIYPGLLRLTWQPAQKLQLGEKWQLTVRLKRPHGFASPGSFDLEKYCFAKKIIATGYVLEKNKRMPKILNTRLADEENFVVFYNFTGKLRQYLSDAIIHALEKKEFAGVVLALVTGVQYKISPTQWQVVRDTGVAHLLAISGLHIGFVAGFAFVLGGLLWRCMPRRYLLQIPAPIVGAGVAIITALAYAYLAGFSVSSQRSCIMVVLAMIGIILRRVILPADIFGCALLLVLLLSPFVVLTLSFWLSFTAVAILLYCFTGRKVINKFDKWLKPSVVTTVGMAPLLLACFNTVPLLSTLANFIAIPWVSFFVVPLALFGSIIYPLNNAIAVSLWSAADLLLTWLWPILLKLQQLPMANWQPQISSPWCLLLAFVGTLWLLAPKGFPGRIFGLCGFLPLLFPQLSHLQSGELKFSMLDVGQGLAVVIQTRNHVLVYDTGPKFSMTVDAGEQVLWPFLLSQHIRQIDALIVSHTDLDHSGGMRSLLQHIQPAHIFTPIPALLLEKVGLNQATILPAPVALNAMTAGAGRVTACVAGQHWRWDDVDFTMLHPRLPLAEAKNEHSCVLHIKSPTTSILLTGDIGHASEKVLIANYKTLFPVDILSVPHHGSKNSSAKEFVALVQAKYALASAGYLNRYQHPHPLAKANYLARGTEFLATARNGTISFNIGLENKQVKPNCYRINQRKIWYID